MCLSATGCLAQEWITIEYTAENLITNDEDVNKNMLSLLEQYTF